jgi:hypothetical protein
MEISEGKFNEKTGKEDYISSSYSSFEKNITIFRMFDAILKTPGKIIYEISDGTKAFQVYSLQIIILIVSLMVFGIINGFFSGGLQIIYSTVKYPLVIILSAIICLPSLYIFLSLSGSNIKIKQIIGILLMSIALASIILLGFAPVLWIFSQSTESITFMGVLNFIFWIIASSFCFRLLYKAVEYITKKENSIIIIWIFIFSIVLFQMTTTFRPLIGPSESFLPESKLFFLSYWFN